MPLRRPGRPDGSHPAAATDPGRDDPGSLHHLPSLALADLVPSPGGLLWVVAPHPGDETLGIGGVVAAASNAGASVRVVAVTDGELSPPSDDRRAVAELRRGEQTRALAHLTPAADAVRLLMPDGGVGLHATQLGRHLHDLFGPLDVVLTTWEGDGHPDHEAVGSAVLATARRTRSRVVQYPVHAWSWAAPGDGRVPWSRMRRVTLDAAALRCRGRALAEHASQELRAADLSHLARRYEVVLL